MDGAVGWLEFFESGWQFGNLKNDYLPLAGIAEKLTGRATDTEYVYFYFSGTIRVEEVEPERLANLDWYYRALKEAEELWRDGELINAAVD